MWMFMNTKLVGRHHWRLTSTNIWHPLMTNKNLIYTFSSQVSTFKTLWAPHIKFEEALWAQVRWTWDIFECVITCVLLRFPWTVYLIYYETPSLLLRRNIALPWMECSQVPIQVCKEMIYTMLVTDAIKISFYEEICALLSSSSVVGVGES